eukprot:1140146-Pelagomonas_calceolata.AAC.2
MNDLHLDLGKRSLKNIARFRLHAHTSRVETSLCQEHASACDRCDQGGLHDEKRAVFLCSCDSKQHNHTYRFILDIDIFCAVGTVEQAEQPNYLVEGQTPL